MDGKELKDRLAAAQANIKDNIQANFKENAYIGDLYDLNYYASFLSALEDVMLLIDGGQPQRKNFWNERI